MKPLWILVAGPYATGAATAAEREVNRRRLHEAALALHRRGHVPLIGVDAALPLIDVAGPAHYEEIMLPLSLALAERCDAVLRLAGASSGADREVERIRARGGRVFTSLAEVPAPAAGGSLRGARIFLAAVALVLAVYAIAFLVDPSLLGRLVGLAFTEANAAVEIRAFYGGLELGLAAFFAWAALRPALTAPALVAFACAFGAAGLARALGCAQYGFAGPSQPVVAGIEMAAAVAAGRLARAVRVAAGGR